MMTYEEARAFIAWTGTIGYRLGLDSVTELLRRLGNPQDDLKFVHIAGTNGKGSVLAFTSTILTKAGYRVGRYISPTIYSYRERIQVNEEYITREELALLTEQVKEAGASMLADGLLHPTAFEVETAIAFLHFKNKKCDIVTLETGMGGLTDATNVVKTTLVSALVSISMDHMQYLGDTLAKITEMKAGIIKPNTYVVSTYQKPEAAEVIRRTCEERNCSLIEVDEAQITDVTYGLEQQVFSYKNTKNLTIRLSGSYQIENAAITCEVIAALRKCGFDIPERAMRDGFEQTVWRARFYKVMDKPLFLIDGAHNRGAADRLKESVELYLKDRRKIFIMGVFSDKEYDYVASQLCPLADEVITVMTPDNPRALPAEELAVTVEKYNPNVRASAGLKDAVDQALKAAGPDDVILAFGSLSYLGELNSLIPSDTQK